MRCGDVFTGGCDHPVAPGSWVHDDAEWIDGDRRPTGPWLRDDLPEPFLHHLATDADWRVREQVAKHPRTPPALLDQLAVDPWPQVRWEGLRRTRSVALLRGPLDEGDRAAAASNERCPTDLLERWSTDPSHIVRHRVVRHPATPPAVVDRFVTDPDDSIRGLAAARTRTREVIAAAASSPDPVLRYGVAGNPACPKGLRRRLAKDEAPQVRARAVNPAGHPSRGAAGGGRSAGPLAAG